MVELISGILFLIMLFLLVMIFKNKAIFISLLCFAPVTFWGAFANIGFVIDAVGIFAVCNGVKIFKLNRVLIFSIVLIFVLFPIVFLSIYNGAYPHLNFVKYFQLIFVFSSLVFFSSSNLIIEKPDIESLVKIFLFFTGLAGLLIHFTFDAYNEGMFRFSGLFFDANYYGLICLLLYFALDLFESESKMLKILIISFLFLSLSSTAIACFILYLFFTKIRFFPTLVKSKYILFFILFSNMFYFSFIDFLSQYKASAEEGSFLAYKLVSMSQRLSVQIDAIALIKSDYGWLFGYGSGRNIELVGRALHNGFLQYSFSHGILFFLINILIITYTHYVLKVRSKSLSSVRKLSGIYLAIIFSCFFLDTFSSLYTHFIAIVYSSYLSWKVSINTIKADV